MQNGELPNRVLLLLRSVVEFDLYFVDSNGDTLFVTDGENKNKFI